jgi:hypothetical protein
MGAVVAFTMAAMHRLDTATRLSSSRGAFRSSNMSQAASASRSRGLDPEWTDQSSDLTISSTIFFASASSIIVLSR